MPLFSAAELALAEGLTAITTTNPFLPARVELERRLLGRDYVEIGAAKALRSAGAEGGINTAKLVERGARVLEAARARLASGTGRTGTERECELYEGLALFVLYHRWRDDLGSLLSGLDESSPSSAAAPLRVPWYPRFRQEAVATLHGLRLPGDFEPAHLFALFFQIARAFREIYANLIGGSPAAIRLRATVWQSIFTHDVRRYQRVLYGRMADLATLVTGRSGTGKELVARAVGRAGYLPFDEGSRSFELDPATLFLPLNLSALSPQLIESELFGYRKNAFTGALQDRAGWFETCPSGGAVFLDEIGESAPEIQVKLLRVLQTRRFQRLGDTEPRAFRGKLISATNRDLAVELAAGRFREDLYYRICSDHIETPTLAEQVCGDRDELHHLLLFIARRHVGEEGEIVAQEALAWIERELGLDYAWPGNFRELEQCVRNVLIRERYDPRPPARPVPPELAEPSARADPLEELVRRLRAAELTAEELLSAYCTLAYARTGSFDGAARRIGLDRRTIRARVDAELLARLAR